MRIKEKINLDREGLMEQGAITIVALGDSVTHCRDLDCEDSYHAQLRRKILSFYGYVPVNVINSGIGGTRAVNALPRLEKQVFIHNPDLVIVCFGLNDVNRSIEEYLDSLRTIFYECRRRDIETVFLTPNMMCTYVSDEAPEEYLEAAERCAEHQRSGRMDEFVEKAKELALSMNIKVADAYSVWKERAKSEDITLLLQNRINHPTPEMHRLFADKIFEQIFDGSEKATNENESTMYKG